jgi:hypothetical protein
MGRARASELGTNSGAPNARSLLRHWFEDRRRSGHAAHPPRSPGAGTGDDPVHAEADAP